MVARALSIATGALVTTAAAAAFADEQPQRITDVISVSAGDVDADPALRELTLRDGVVVTYQRYRIEADSLHLQLTPGGIMVEGEGRVSFCPCAEPPIAIAFSGGRVAPPGDLLVAFPRLEVLGVPVFALPYLWLRSPEKVGLLPPRLAWRGDDGLLAGAGVHIPWRGSDGQARTLDVRGAGYIEGGAEASARLETPVTSTSLVIDQIRGTRAVIDARGSLPPPREATDTGAADPALSWDVDAVRGDRARSGTVELATAAQPYDAGAIETAFPLGAGGTRGVVGAGLRARGARGEGRIFGGPLATTGIGGPLGEVGTWDGALHAALVGDGDTASAAAASGVLGAELDARPGPLQVRLGARGRGRVSDGAAVTLREEAQDVAGAARLEAGLPLARAFGGRAGAPPLIHTIGPLVDARLALGARRGAAVFDEGRAPIPARSWLTAVGAGTSLGNYAGRAVRLELRAGAYGEEDEAPLALAHGRLHASTTAMAAGAEAALTGADADALEIPSGGIDADPAGRAGAAALAHLRLGPQDGPYLGVDAAAQAGSGAAAARAVAGGTAGAIPGDELDYLETTGWTGGAETLLPLTRTWRTLARVDADLTAAELLSIRAGLGYRHRCGCLAAELVGLHRLGRGGVDVWFTVDLAPP